MTISKKLFIILSITVIGILIGVGIWYSQNQTTTVMPPSDASGKIWVGTTSEYSALISLAEDLGYFKNNGLDVKTVEYTSGAPAFSDMLSGKADMILTADFVGVLNSFTTENFKILASLAKVKDGFELVARRDHNIRTPADLKGKKIGITKRTSGEFWLGTFLIFNHLKAQDITVVDLAPQQLEEQIASGKIDAVMTFEPHVFNIKNTLKGNAISWSGQNGQDIHPLLYSTINLVKNHPIAIQRFIKALVEAEDYLKKNPQGMLDFIARHYHYSSDYIKSVIPKFTYTVSLDESLLLSMEDEARWAIDSKLTDKTVVPNYLNFISTDALNAVKPEAITLIR